MVHTKGETAVLLRRTKLLILRIHLKHKVDHQSYSNNDVFQQRYIISTQYWKPNGPIFFYAGNEGDIFSFANNTGFMWENAPKFNAMVVFMEHRYYGQSMPYGNNSFKVSATQKGVEVTNVLILNLFTSFVNIVVVVQFT